MIQTIPITTSPLQEMSFKLFSYDLRFTLRYNIMGAWNYDLFDKKAEKYICQSMGLAVGAPSLIGRNLPFVIVLHDTSGQGINTVQMSDMGSRLQVFVMSKEAYYEEFRKADTALFGKRAREH